jgi:hypothetical protein
MIDSNWKTRFRLDDLWDKKKIDWLQAACSSSDQVYDSSAFYFKPRQPDEHERLSNY